MGFIIADSVSLSIGEAKSNVWGKVKFHTGELLITGKVQCDISFYKSEADNDSGKDQIYPLSGTGSKVVGCTIECALADVIKASGQSTMVHVVDYFYNKVKTELETKYGWSITID